MHKPLALASCATLQLLLALPAQDARADAQWVAEVARAQQSLRDPSVATQLDAIRKLGALAANGGARAPKALDAVAAALKSNVPEVVEAAIAVLLAEQQPTGVAHITSHLARLRQSLKATPEPSWPSLVADLDATVRAFKEKPPELPPEPKVGATEKERREYVAAVKKVAQHNKEGLDLQAKLQAEVKQKRDAAAAAARVQRTAADELSKFASRIPPTMPPTVVEELVSALSTIATRWPWSVEPIVATLCRSDRRDAVAAVTRLRLAPEEAFGPRGRTMAALYSALVTGPDAYTSAWKACPVRSLPELFPEQTEMLTKLKSAESDPPAIVSVLAQVERHLRGVGERCGVATPESGQLSPSAWQSWLEQVQSRLTTR